MEEAIHQFPPIVFVRETQALPGSFVERMIALERSERAHSEHAHFESTWLSLKAHVVTQITSDSLLRISRWATEQMQRFSLPADWLEHVPLRAVAYMADERIIRFGQFKEEGYPLPSHHPLVFRRLLLCVDYDRHERRIAQIIVTISGWVEE